MITTGREPPTIELNPSTQTVVQGGNTLLQCKVTAGIPTPSITWARVDGRLLSNNVEELEGGIIRFNRVTGNEEGQYICKAENDAGSITDVATLTIQSIPVVTISPRKGLIHVKKGQRLRLECSAQGNPRPSVSWKRLRTGFSLDAIDAQETHQIAVYEIASSGESDEGTYSCTGRNDAGSTEERIQIVIDIEENEKLLTNEGQRNRGVIIGNTIQLPCNLTGRVQWRRDRGKLPPTAFKTTDNKLKITNVQPSDAGRYLCEGTSPLGRASEYVVLTVKSKCSLLNFISNFHQRAFFV